MVGFSRIRTDITAITAFNNADRGVDVGHQDFRIVARQTDNQLNRKVIEIRHRRGDTGSVHLIESLVEDDDASRLLVEASLMDDLVEGSGDNDVERSLGFASGLAARNFGEEGDFAPAVGNLNIVIHKHTIIGVKAEELLLFLISWSGGKAVEEILHQNRIVGIEGIEEKVFRGNVFFGGEDVVIRTEGRIFAPGYDKLIDFAVVAEGLIREDFVEFTNIGPFIEDVLANLGDVVFFESRRAFGLGSFKVFFELP